MIVHVKLYAQLRAYHPGPNRSQPLPVELADGATARALAAQLRLPEALVRGAFVNGEQRDLDAPLQDGEQVSLISPVVGGMAAGLRPTGSRRRQTAPGAPQS